MSGEGNHQGAASGPGHTSSTEPLAGLGPAGGSPSREILAACAIVDVWMGGKRDWRTRLDESEFLDSADWQMAITLARVALASSPWPAGYQETFNAIAAATRVHAGSMIGISVKSFYRALSYPDSPVPAPAAETPAERVCHEEQMTIWTGEIAGSLSMGGYLRECLSYDDKLDLHAVIAACLRSIIGSAFLQVEPPAPVDGSGEAGKTKRGLTEGDSAVAEAISEGQAPDLKSLQDEIQALRSALQDSERKRVEAIEALKPFAIAAERYEPDEGDGDHSLWADDGLRVRHLREARRAFATPTQETPHAQG